jgi:hypothetical protein
MTRGRGFRIILMVSAGILAILFLSVGLDKLAGIPVMGALRGFDRGVHVGGISFAEGLVILRDADFPGRALHLENAVVYWSGGLLNPRVDSVLILEGCWEPNGSPASSGDGSSGREMPPVRFAGMLVVSGADSAEACGSLSSGCPGLSRAFDRRMSIWMDGNWGALKGTVFSGSLKDSIGIDWFSCKRIPGRILQVPEMFSGLELQGSLTALRTDHTTLWGMIDRVDGDPAEIDFRMNDEDGYPRVRLSSRLENAREVLVSQASDLLGDVYVDMSPAGSFTLEFEDSDTVGVEVNAVLDSLRLYSPGLADDTVQCEVSLSFKGWTCLEQWTVGIDSGRISMGDLSTDFSVRGRFSNCTRLELAIWNDSISGSDLVSSMPGELLGSLDGLQLSGYGSLRIELVLDWGSPDSSDFHADIDAGRLGVVYSPISIGHLRYGGSCIMRDSWGNSRRIYLDTLQNNGFVVFDSLNPCFEGLLKCAEDATFRSHDGFCEYHIRNSIRANMQSGHFTRGGSTISMQLARNLFLGREKTLARKIQEVFLTWRLESYLTKDRMLEIYANIVELGPDVFGFDEAGLYYFGRNLRDLSTREVAYLVSILPGPRLYHRFFSSGRIPDYWESYLDRLIRISRDRGWITGDSAASALGDSIVFGNAERGF